MRNILFVASHLYSGSDSLIRDLNENERILIHNLQLSYEHPTNMEYIFSLGHKLNNSAAIYGDHLLFNKDFSSKSFYEFSKFIYVIRPAKPVLNEIFFHEKSMTELCVLRHYSFRLRRLYEMAKHTPGSIFLTCDQFESANELIADYLQLKEPLNISKFVPTDIHDKMSHKIVKQAQDCYERYLFDFKNLNLKRI